MTDKYEYKHIIVPFTDDQMMLMHVPLDPQARAPLDVLLETALNEAGAEGWRIVQPLSLPNVLMERKVTETDG